MAKRVVSFKPTPECEVQLAELTVRWGCDRTAAIIRAIEIAQQDQVERTAKPLPRDPVPGVDETPKPQNWDEPAEAKLATGGVDHDKIADLQRLSTGRGSVKRMVPLVSPSYPKRGDEVSPVPKGKK